MGTSLQARLFVSGALASGACAAMPGDGASPVIAVTSATGFVPVTWSEPTNGIGFGDGGRHGGSGLVPFAGWADFGLPGDPSFMLEWNFAGDASSRWLAWSVVRLDAPDTPLAGVSWDGVAWRALGGSSTPPTASGSWLVTPEGGRGPVAFRVRFEGFTSDPDGLGWPVLFSVPTPGAVTLAAVAVWAARRRRT